MIKTVKRKKERGIEREGERSREIELEKIK